MAIARAIYQRVKGKDPPTNRGNREGLIGAGVHAPIDPNARPPSRSVGEGPGSAVVLAARASGRRSGDAAFNPSRIRNAACSFGERHSTSARSLRAAAAASGRRIVSEGTIRLNVGRGREINEPKTRRTSGYRADYSSSGHIRSLAFRKSWSVRTATSSSEARSCCVGWRRC